MQIKNIKAFSNAPKLFDFLNTLIPYLHYFPNKPFPPWTGKINFKSTPIQIMVNMGRIQMNVISLCNLSGFKFFLILKFLLINFREEGKEREKHLVCALTGD